MTWFLDLRAEGAGGSPAREVTVRRDANATPLDVLLEEVRGRDVLLATHGFNVDRKSGIASLSAWSELLQLGDNARFLGVLWPGDSRWLPVVDYPFEGDEARDCGRLLAPFLDRYLNVSTSISFVSHSLGARMVLETISQLRTRVRRLTLMAGAIEDDTLVNEYADVPPKVDEISVLASHEDYVLRLAFPIGNTLGGIVYRGHPYWRGALGLDGPDGPFPENLTPGWQIPSNWDYGHADYFGDAAPPCLNPPVNVPPNGAPKPSLKSAWSAGFVSTRFRRG
jgi:pimeloyl-ACP methyl ester carboxylesterase